MKFFRALLFGWLAYLATSVGFYVVPFLALLRRGRPRPPERHNPQPPPVIHVVCACRDGAASVPGLARTFRAQTYPRNRFKLTLVADNCRDETAGIARHHGLNVYERNDLATAGKGNAVTEFVSRRLRREAFDILVVVDVDGRVEPDFLERLASYFPGDEARALSCATYARDPERSHWARTGDVIQALLRLHQESRAALGKDAVFYGSHGYALSRAALGRIHWVTCTGLVGEDMECRMRSVLAGTPVVYGPDLRMYNDVTHDRVTSLEQRRRWNAIYFPLIRTYLPPLLHRGDLDSAFGVLLLPGLGNLALYLAGTAAGLAVAGRRNRTWRALGGAATALSAAHAGYIVAALRRAGVPLNRGRLRSFASYLAVKTLALAQSAFFLRQKDWAPAAHGADE